VIGEERFLIHLDHDDAVRVEVRAFSRPGQLLTRIGAPAARRLQDVTTKRYLRALSFNAEWDYRRLPRDEPFNECLGRIDLLLAAAHNIVGSGRGHWGELPEVRRDPLSAGLVACAHSGAVHLLAHLLDCLALPGQSAVIEE